MIIVWMKYERFVNKQKTKNKRMQILQNLQLMIFGRQEILYFIKIFLSNKK